MFPEVNKISGKATIASINGAGGSGGALSPTVGVLGGRAPQENSKALKSI